MNIFNLKENVREIKNKKFRAILTPNIHQTTYYNHHHHQYSTVVIYYDNYYLLSKLSSYY
jgi:hypothetical protein